MENDDYDPRKEMWDSTFFQINRYGDAGDQAMAIVDALGGLISDGMNSMGSDAIKLSRERLIGATKAYCEREIC